MVFGDRLSKMDHLAAVPISIDGNGTAMLFIDRVFRQHGLPLAIISNRVFRFTSKFWTSIFKVLGTRWTCSQQIIYRPIVKLSEFIVSSAMFFAVLF